MEQSINSQPHQKVMTLLHKKYSQALLLLKQGRLPEGSQSLLQILQHPQANDSDLENLRYSILMSLAEVYRAEGDLITALGFLWQALQTLQRRFESVQKGQSTLKQQSDERSQEEFTLLLKMILIVQKLNLPEQLIYLLKKAIKISPALWREKLVSKLAEIYQKQGYCEALKDLIFLCENRQKMQQILNEKVDTPTQLNSMHPSLLQITSQPCIQKLHFTLNLFQKQQLLLKYTNWETLLTITYVLLKCQSKRNFNKKKYLHRKYDQSNRQWNQFLRFFSLTKTKISISFVRQQEIGQNIEAEGQKSSNCAKMVTDLAFQLLKARHLKKKNTKKALNPLQELARMPSVNAKDQKKNIAAQTKSVYPSINHYFRDLISKYHVKKELLDDLKILNEGQYELIIGQILKAEPQPMKPEGEENEEELDGSVSVGLGISEGQKDSREKKTIKAKKKDLIECQRELNSYIAQFFDRANSNEPVIFGNVCEMIEEITTMMFDEPEKSKRKIALTTNASIRKILSKNIVKVIQVGVGFFQEIGSLQFLDLLMQKFQQLVDKDPKSVPFKAYQQYKKKLLIDTIKNRFQPNPYQLQVLLSSERSEQQLRKVAQICLYLVKLNSLYGHSFPEQAAFYRDLYVVFKSRQELQTQKISNSQTLERRIASLIDKEIEKYQKKIATRSNLLAINQEAEEQVNNIEDLYKKDRQISAMLPLLKVFKCHPEQLKLKLSEAPEQISSNIYLQTFSKLAELFFKKIDLQSKTQFNCRLLTLLSQIIKLKQIVTFLYEKTTDGVTFKIAPSQINQTAYTKAAFYLLKLHFLNLIQENDYCLKMVFVITNALMRCQSQEIKYSLISKYICLFDELIRYKKNKPQHTYSLRKRFYQNFILKNIGYIYNSPLFGLEKEENKVSRPRKLNRARSQSEQAPNIPDIIRQPLSSEDIKDKVFDILHDVYFSSDKEREFNPKKIQEAVGYFMYLLRAYHEIFTDRVIELQYQALKMFKKCYKIYIEKRDDAYKFCEKFKSFINQFNLFINGQQNKINKQELVQIIKLQRPICECCTKLTKTHSFYIESLFVLGKFYEAQFAQPQLAPNREVWLQDLNKDQIFYCQYMALNLNKQSAWENLIRVNASKAFFYFDSLLSEPFDRFKNKFFLTKKLILFLGEVFPHFCELQRYGSANIQILNILKIKERQYLMIQKEIQTMNLPSRESRELQKKYLEGIKKVHASTVSQFSNDVRVRYLRLSELKYKLIWNALEKEKLEDKAQEASVIIELDEQSNQSKVLHPPSRNVQQLAQTIQQAKKIVTDIYASPQSKQLLHLQQDIVMELYIFLGRHLEWKLNKVLYYLCKSIGTTTHGEKYKNINDAQFYISDLNHTLQLFSDPQFISSNPRYKLLQDKLNSSAEDHQTLSSNLSRIFFKQQPIKEQKVQEIKPENELQEILRVNQSNLQEGVPDLNRSKMSDQSVGKESKRSNSRSSEKQTKMPKSLIINLGSYITKTVSDHIINHKLQKVPLNHLQGFFSNPFFQELVLKMTRALSEISRVMIQLPRYQIKKYKNRRSVVMSLLYCSHLAITYTNTPQRANQLIKDYYSFKNQQFTFVNLYNDKLSAQRNELLADFYNRSIVHQIMRIQFIRQTFNVFAAQGHKQNLVLLAKKLLKLSRSNQSKAQKQKQTKNHKQCSMQIEGAEGQRESKDKMNIQRQSKASKSCKDLESTTYVALFCEATLKLKEMLAIQSDVHELEEKYQKNMLEFRNKIKKIVNDDKNPYYCQIDRFINNYQNQYNKKIKLKKTKKDKELPQPSQLQIGQRMITFEFPIQCLNSQPRAEQIQEQSASVNRHNSPKSMVKDKGTVSVTKKRRVIEKKQRVPRLRKSEGMKRQKVVSKEAGNKEEPIEIKQSPQKEDVIVFNPPVQVEQPIIIQASEQTIKRISNQIQSSTEKAIAPQKQKTSKKKLTVDKTKNLPNTSAKLKQQEEKKGKEEKDDKEEKEKPSRLSRRISDRKAQSHDKDKLDK